MVAWATTHIGQKKGKQENRRNRSGGMAGLPLPAAGAAKTASAQRKITHCPGIEDSYSHDLAIAHERLTALESMIVVVAHPWRR